MSIAIESRGIADVRPAGAPHGIPGIGFGRLQFPIEFQLHGCPSPAARLEQLLANVYAGRPGGAMRPLGKARPQNSWFTQVFEHGRSETVALELDLQPAALEALEQLREGGPLLFQIDLSLQVRRGERIEPAYERVNLPVNLSDWAQVIQALGHRDILIVAVELPMEVFQELSSPLGELRAAHQDLIAGRYDATVMRCRRAMDGIGTHLVGADPERIWERFASARGAMTKSERAELVRLAVRHFSHLAAHVDQQGAPETFSRQDALFILTAAAGVLWDATSRIGGSSSSRNPGPP